MTVYLDLLIVVNLLVNYLLIRLTAMLTGAELSVKRLLGSSVFGAVFSLIIIFDMPAVVSMAARLVSVLLCTYISFGYKSRFSFIKRIITLLCLYMLFTGFLMIMSENSAKIYVNNFSFYISINPVVFVGSICIFYILLAAAEFIFCREPTRYLHNIMVETKYGNFTATAFYDTGFKLRDVMCNNSVIMCSMDFLTGAGMHRAVNTAAQFYIDGIHKGTDILPLFYSDVSGGGMLPAFRTEKVIISKDNNFTELKNVLLAVSKNRFSNRHEVIFGKDIYDRLGD